MKKILFLLLICNVCKAQQYSKYDNHKYYNKKYKGYIKQVTNSYYTNFYLDSGKFKKNDTIQNAGSKLNSYSKDSFNISGNIQKILSHMYKDTSKFWSKEYSYDNYNNLIAISSRNSDNPATSHSIFKYNKGILETVDEYANKKFLSETVFFYNKKGVLKKTETTPFESKMLHKEKFGEDNSSETINYYKKRIFSKSFTMQDDTSFFNIGFPNLDDSNSTASEIRIYKGDELYICYSGKRQKNNGVFLEDYSCIETHYDEHKNLTKLVTYDNIRKVSYTTTIDYKYDTVGNIIERLITYDSGNKELRKSKFEYY